jgi:hypothetical protein
VGLKAEDTDGKYFGQTQALVILTPKHRVLPRKEVKGSVGFECQPIKTRQRPIRCRLVFFKPLSPKIAAPNASLKQTDRHALLDIEDVLVLRTVRRMLLLFGIAM